MPARNDVKFAALMSFITTFLVSLVIVSVNLGLVLGWRRFLFVWMRSWVIAFAMVFVAILFLAPRIRAHTHK